MPTKPIRVSENSNIQLPLRNLISIIGAVAVGVWAYFGVIERLNTIETNGKLMIADVEKITARVDEMMNNKVNIERLIKDVDKIAEQLEILKDKVRANGKNH